MGLKPEIQQRIINYLDDTFFTAEAFNIQFNISSSELVRITLKTNENYYFIIKEKKDDNYYLSFKISPGEIKDVDNFNTSFNELNTFFFHWSNNIISAIKFERSKKVKNDTFINIDDYIKNIGGDEVKYEEGEIEKLKKSVDRFHNALNEKFNELELVKEDIKKLQKELDELKGMKNDIELMPRKAWYKKFVRKSFGIIKKYLDTPEGRTLAIDLMKKAILPGSE